MHYAGCLTYQSGKCTVLAVLLASLVECTACAGCLTCQLGKMHRPAGADRGVPPSSAKKKRGEKGKGKQRKEKGKEKERHKEMKSS